MKRKQLGRTDLMVTENSFGALPIQRIDKQSAVELLHMAYDGGINFYDTARAYSDSEEKLGEAFHDRRDKIVISTKSMAKDKAGLLKDLDESLRMLRTDYVDIMQLHNIQSVPDPEDENGLYQGLLEAQRQGKCRFIGITSHRRAIAEEAAKSGLYDTIQFPVSHISPQEDIDLIALCKELNLGFIAMKALSGGLLTSAEAAYAFFQQFDNAVPIWGDAEKRGTGPVPGLRPAGSHPHPGAGGGHRQGPGGAGRQLLPRLRLLHALPPGDSAEHHLPASSAAAPLPLAAVHERVLDCGTGQSGDLPPLRAVRIPLPLRPQMFPSDRREPGGLAPIPQGKRHRGLTAVPAAWGQKIVFPKKQDPGDSIPGIFPFICWR